MNERTKIPFKCQDKFLWLTCNIEQFIMRWISGSGKSKNALKLHFEFIELKLKFVLESKQGRPPRNSEKGAVRCG